MTSPPTTRIAKARPREGLAPDDPLRQAELRRDGADLVLEQHPQRLDELEVQVLGQTADVVVGLDRRRPGAPVAAGLDHIRVERSLDEEADVRQLLRLLLEHADELLADDLALALGLDHAGEPLQEALLSGHVDEPDPPVAKRLDHLLRLVLSQQAVVDEHAGELIARRRGGRAPRRSRSRRLPRGRRSRLPRRPGRALAATCSSITEAGDQRCSRPATSRRKRSRICVP